nr:hypothetical protein [uncultured Methanolobus sp.]
MKKKYSCYNCKIVKKRWKKSEEKRYEDIKGFTEGSVRYCHKMKVVELEVELMAL